MSHWVKDALAVKPGRIAWLDGAIAGATFAVPVVVGLWLGFSLEATVVAAISTMTVAMMPRDTWFTRRIWALLTDAVGTVLLVVVAALAAPVAWSSILLMAFVAFVAPFAAEVGPGGRLAAMLFPQVTILVLTLAAGANLYPLAVAAAAGGLWAVLVGVVTTRVRRERPASQRLMDMYSVLADMIEATTRSESDFATARQRCDDAIEAAMAVTQTPGFARAATRAHLGAARGRIGQVVSLHAHLIVLRVNLGDTAANEVLEFDLAEVSAWARRCGSRTVDPTARLPTPPVVPSPALFAADRHWAQALQGLGQVMAPADWAARGQAMWLADSPASRLRAAWSWQSSVLRQATQFSAAVTMAAIVAWLAPTTHGWWVVLTVTVVLKGDVSSTMATLPPRIVGTIVGAVLGGLLLNLLTGAEYVIAVVAAGCLTLMIAYRPRQYLFWVVGISTFAILTLGLAGDTGWTSTGWRIAATLVGGLIAVLCAYLIWPERGIVQVPKLTQELVRDLAALLQPTTSNDAEAFVHSYRRAVIQEQNLLQSLASARSEPGVDRSIVDAWTEAMVSLRSVRDQIIADRHAVTAAARQPIRTRTARDQLLDIAATTRYEASTVTAIRIANDAAEVRATLSGG